MKKTCRLESEPMDERALSLAERVRARVGTRTRNTWYSFGTRSAAALCRDYGSAIQRVGSSLHQIVEEETTALGREPPCNGSDCGFAFSV